jgi:hypothetical protein
LKLQIFYTSLDINLAFSVSPSIDAPEIETADCRQPSGIMLTNHDIILMVREIGKKRCIETIVEGTSFSASAIRHKIDRLGNKVKMLKKTKAKAQDLQDYLGSPFFQNSNNSSSVGEAMKRLNSKLNAMKLRLQIQRAELRRKGSRLSYCWKRIQQLERSQSSLKEEINKLLDEKTGLEGDLSAYKGKIADMEAQLELKTEETTRRIETKKLGGHTNATKECVFQLLDLNVSTGHIAPVMECVLRFANVEVNDLPKKSTVNEWHICRLILAQNQIAEKIGPDQYICLLSDETSKFGIKYQGFHACTSEGEYVVLGLRNIASKAGASVLSTFQEILQDIEETSLQSQNEVAKKILLNIVSTMSDRAATQKKFNELLEEYRKTLLPDIVKDYSLLTEAEQASVGTLLNFFCGLHSLVHMAEAASSSIKAAEEGFFDSAPIFNKAFKTAEPGATRLVRTSCKAFS